MNPNAESFRLGMDLRIASEKPEGAYVVEAFMEQRKKLLDEAVDESMPVVLTHAARDWEGKLKQAKSQRNLVRWNFFSKWEQDFIEDCGLNVWHQFAPVDKIRSTPCASLVTVLPPISGLPSSVSSQAERLYAVPSPADADILAKRLGRGREKIRTVLSPIRSVVHAAPAVRPPDEGWLLFLVGRKQDVPRAEKWIQLLSGRFPRAARKIVYLESESRLLQGESWLATLQKARFCFYLSRSPFDWAVPAFESMYCRVPTIFIDDCHAISQHLQRSPLSLPRFLVETPDAARAQAYADEAFGILQEAGVFDPTRFGTDLMRLQRELGGPEN